MTKEQCIALIAGKLRGRAVLMLETGFEPNFVYAYLKDKTVIAMSGVPPLTFKANGQALKNYRIYGNTANSESVGDRTENLFDNGITIENGTINTETGAESAYQAPKRLRTSFIGYFPAGNYVISVNGVDRVNCITLYSSKNTDDFIETVSTTSLLPKPFTLNEGGYIRIAFSKTDNSDISPYDISNIMLNAGSESLPYEPYGYRVPVTVTNGTDTQTTNIYLHEQIKTVAGVAEHIDYKAQKQYFADGTSADVTLPEISTLNGTNTLTVGTVVQPSKVEIKYKR